ncbi:MAG: sterol desaturase family protein [Ginsengibacter sp.]
MFIPCWSIEPISSMIGFLNNQSAILISIPLTFLLIVTELYISYRYDKKYYSFTDTKHNILLGVIFAGVEALLSGGCLLMMNVIAGVGFKVAPANAWVYWITLYFFEDLLYYTMHFLDHHIRILWAGHITHHSSDKFNFSVGLRAAIFEPVEKFIFFIPLALIGYHAIDILLVYILSQTFGTLAHTNLIKKLGVLDYFLVTPSNHRVHHAKNIRYLDKNFGMTIVIWDKIFGTYEKEEEEEPVEFGVQRTTPYTSFADVVTNEIKQIIKDASQEITLRQKLKYIFGLPGYSHDGSRKTTKQLRQENISENQT